jgi:hypothetical protein
VGGLFGARRVDRNVWTRGEERRQESNEGQDAESGPHRHVELVGRTDGEGDHRVDVSTGEHKPGLYRR